MIDIFAVMAFVAILACAGFLLAWKDGHFHRK